MSKPRVTRCGDGHYRRVIYSLGPYIADYPEQCLLAAVVSGWCPRFVLYGLNYFLLLNLTEHSIGVLLRLLIWMETPTTTFNDLMNIPARCRRHLNIMQSIYGKVMG